MKKLILTLALSAGVLSFAAADLRAQDQAPAPTTTGTNGTNGCNDGQCSGDKDGDHDKGGEKHGGHKGHHDGGEEGQPAPAQ